ncbi:26s proteasome subunit [Cystoisospora suis]|uniref:26s proteasome subunit n=1 Tax=Cystoisospora suis TaxID=483139 RepID=A0A2C6LAJ8_9APIC|nr:26s proteasome subunit [Cystoisospora suis]
MSAGAAVVSSPPGMAASSPKKIGEGGGISSGSSMACGGSSPLVTAGGVNSFCVAAPASSAAGVLALLHERDPELQVAALHRLHQMTDLWWTEIADYLSDIEALYEDESFSGRQLAAFIASRVYFHLEEYGEAMKFALVSGKWFDVTEKSLYVQRVLGECVDTFIQNGLQDFCRQQLAAGRQVSLQLQEEVDMEEPTGGASTAALAEAVESVVKRLLQVCTGQGDGSLYALGIAFDARRLDLVQEILNSPRAVALPPTDRSSKFQLLLVSQYCLENMQTLISSKCFRSQLISLLISEFERLLPLYDPGVFTSPSGMSSSHEGGEQSLSNAFLSRKHQEAGTKENPSTSALTALHRVTSEQERAEIRGLLYSGLCRCLVQEDDSNRVAELLTQLLLQPHQTTKDSNREEEGVLMACQIAFDLLQLERQSFQQALLAHPLIKARDEPSSEERSGENDGASSSSTAAAGDANNPSSQSQSANGNGATEGTHQTSSSASGVTNGAAAGSGTNGVVDTPEGGSIVPAEKKKDQPQIEETADEKKLKLLRYILSGEAQTAFSIQFLHRENRADIMLLDVCKRSIDSRSSLLHHGLVIAHMFMQAGTSCDVFLRWNLDWMARASNWARFSATASLGVVHKGHVRDGMKLLRTYLPSSASSSSSSPYSEGGAFYALGIINANQQSSSIREYLLQQLQAAGTSSEPKQQGCCLGLGLVCLGNHDDAEVYEALKGVLFLDSAVAGEAAAIAVGLLLLGSSRAVAVDELLAYAQDTQHEKIRRACGIAIALLMFKKEEEADALIEKLCSKECDALIRYGGMFTIAMAYCGTANSSAIRRLLHVSVSDVNDDVRRAAVISLGFVLCGDKQQLPQILKVLSGSFNPHVRYGAALALGLACAGSGQKEVVDLLLPLANDSTDFVRQGAFIGLGLVLQQVTEIACSEVGTVRSLLQRVIGDKHEDVMARFGALLATGLIDAGGRNVVASMFSSSGVLRQEAAVGFCLFAQFWYWYPLLHMVALTFTPTALIGLTVSPAPNSSSGSASSTSNAIQDKKKEEKGKSSSSNKEEQKDVEMKEEAEEKKEEGAGMKREEENNTVGKKDQENSSKVKKEDEEKGGKKDDKEEKKENEEDKGVPTGKGEGEKKEGVSNQDFLSLLRLPSSWKVMCVGCRRGQFSYIPSLASLEKKEEKKQTIKAVLSTTAKRNRKLQEQKKRLETEKKKETSQRSSNRDDKEKSDHGDGNTSSSSSSGSSAMEVEVDGEPPKKAKKSEGAEGGSDGGKLKKESDGMEVETEDKDEDSKATTSKSSDKKKEGEEGSSGTGGGEESTGSGSSSSSNNKEDAKEVEMRNPCRVLPQQQPFIYLMPDSRYQPIFPGRKAGFVLLRDTRPTEPDEFLEPKEDAKGEDENAGDQSSGGSSGGAEEREAEPFTPFEWSG